MKLKDILIAVGLTGLTSSAVSCSEEKGEESDSKLVKTEVTNKSAEKYTNEVLADLSKAGIVAAKKGKKNAPDSVLTDVDEIVTTSGTAYKNVKYKAVDDITKAKNIELASVQTDVITKVNDANEIDFIQQNRTMHFEYTDPDQSFPKQYGHITSVQKVDKSENYTRIDRPETYSAIHENQANETDWSWSSAEKIKINQNPPRKDGITITYPGYAYDFTPAEEMAAAVIKQSKDAHLPPADNPQIARVKEALIDLKDKRQRAAQPENDTKKPDQHKRAVRKGVKTANGPHRTRSQLINKPRETD